MKRVLLSMVVCGLVGAALSGGGARAQAPNSPGGVLLIKPGDIHWTDYPNRPGVQLAMLEGDLTRPGPFLVRVKFPAHYTLAPHTHPGIEHTIVLTGALRVGYGTHGSEPMETLEAGTVLITPAGTPHFLETTTETVVQTHGVGPWGSTAVK
jgi:hypothetical protein